MINAQSTPLMKQYHEIRQRYPDALLLFQVGDFYELFFDDAKKASAFLGIALTKRGNHNGQPIPLCGVPVHALDHYLHKLIKGGFKVALCDQLEPAQAGKVVARGVTQLLTPGTLSDNRLLDEKSASYLFSFFPAVDSWGLVFGELLTAQLFATVVSGQSFGVVASELTRFFPDEIIIPATKSAHPFESYFKQMGYYTTCIHDISSDEGTAWIEKQFSLPVRTTVTAHAALSNALHYFYEYVKQTQQAVLDQFNTVHVYKPDDFLILDPATQGHLELVRNTSQGGRTHTLYSVLDRAKTPMGSRMIKKWIMRPLVKKTAIEQRFDALERWGNTISALCRAQELLSEIGDLERVVGRIGLRRASVADYHALARALHLADELMQVITSVHQDNPLSSLLEQKKLLARIADLLKSALNNDSTKEWIIKAGYNNRLDHFRELIQNSGKEILALELAEQQATGIGSLKIRFNGVQGYYIEVTKTHSDVVPDRYVRLQTLAGRERYMIAQLHKLQHEIGTARTESELQEKVLFDQLKQDVFVHIALLRKLAHALAYCDALLGLASVCHDNGYVRPILNEQRQLHIIQGRHPVIEQVTDMRFIANDTHLDDTQSTLIITGPNMGGKSTYLRQVALISVMAQMGCFVPAKSANLAILDRIFTRLGAGDNLAGGKSTFLIEMEETAAICTQATDRSLVILDEVGRGTSTFDGLAIAQAVIEYIHTKIKARCLFATHYHELTLLPEHLPGIASYHASCSKQGDGILFLYSIIKGVADGSFGMEVAQLAHMPPEVIARARAIAKSLTVGNSVSAPNLPNDDLLAVYEQRDSLQKLVVRQQEILARLASVDYDNLSPKKAFDVLWELKGQ